MSRASSSAPSRTSPPVRSRATRSDSFNRKVLGGWWDHLPIRAQVVRVSIPGLGNNLPISSGDMILLVRPVRTDCVACTFVIGKDDLPIRAPRRLGSLVLPKPPWSVQDVEAVVSAVGRWAVAGPRLRTDDKMLHVPEFLTRTCVLNAAGGWFVAPASLDEAREQCIGLSAAADVFDS